jgi:16S rRNA (guanine527-N7)-methyltransferase
MNEMQARQWLSDRLGVSRETLVVLENLEQATIEANSEQNLIARSTVEDFWNRHILDSAQLLPLAEHNLGAWLDLGSGAGFPGLVVALLSDRPVVLAEERRKRVEHLQTMVDRFDLAMRVTVMKGKIEQQQAAPFAVISARAFAPLERLFTAAHHLSSPKTLWVLPKGRSAASELEAARRTWQGSFRIEPSITDPDGAIIVATGVQPRRRR